MLHVRCPTDRTAHRDGTGPWAQGPVPGPREVVLEDNFTVAVTASSVDLARSPGSPSGDPGVVLDRIQVQASQGWPGLRAWRVRNQGSRALQGPGSGPSRAPQTPGSGPSRAPQTPGSGLPGPGSRVPRTAILAESQDPSQFCQNSRLGPPESAVFPESAGKHGKQLFSSFHRLRPASARAELKSTVLTLLGKCQNGDSRATSFYLKARKSESEIGHFPDWPVSQFLEIQAALAYDSDRTDQDRQRPEGPFPRSFWPFLGSGIPVISARHWVLILRKSVKTADSKS